MALFVTVLGFDRWLATIPNRSDLGPRTAIVRFYPVRFDPAGFSPLRLAGAWRVTSDDPRFGGVSALAIDGADLVALTDSGTVLRFSKPATAVGKLGILDLPGGPGNAGFKANRDSEALARDSHGRGWWVAFENRHEVWLYSPAFDRPLARIRLGKRWSRNKGIEGMLAEDHGLLLFPEAGGEVLSLRGNTIEGRRLAGGFGRLSDASPTPDGRMLLVARNFGPFGFDNRLLVLESDAFLHLLAKIPLGRLDNVEALAVEPRGEGAARLWLMTDNDFRPGVRTLLVALDLPVER